MDYRFTKMKRYCALFGLLVAAVLSGCKTDDIMTYDVKNAAVNFNATSYQFSLKGMTETTRKLSLDVQLVGQAVDYDRSINIKIVDNSSADQAVANKDFTLIGGKIKAGELNGVIELEVNKLSEDTPRKTLTLKIEGNEYFREGYPTYSSANIVWSEEYVRPQLYVWRYWHTYFCKYYSRAVHELFVEQLTEEVEKYTCSKLYAETYSLIYKGPFWWYSASRKVRAAVQAHDQAHPEAPLMHSADCMYYSSYNIANGEGTVPTTIPTILETLIAL